MNSSILFLILLLRFLDFGYKYYNMFFIELLILLLSSLQIYCGWYIFEISLWQSANFLIVWWVGWCYPLFFLSYFQNSTLFNYEDLWIDYFIFLKFQSIPWMQKPVHWFAESSSVQVSIELTTREFTIDGLRSHFVSTF